MTKHELTCYCLEALFNCEHWTNTKHGHYIGMMRKSKAELEECYESAKLVKAGPNYLKKNIRDFDYTKIHQEYYAHPNQKNLRFGQWFCNTYVRGPWPELFYCTDYEKANKMILEVANV